MSLHTTMQGDRLHIALFGRRNAGKSSVINGITGQPLAIVSEVKGTTTDPVSKAMEILPLGPCMMIDTPGLDDEGLLGEMRVEKTMQVLNRTDIALVIVDVSQLQELDTERGLGECEMEIISQLEERKIPYLLVLNQTDKVKQHQVDEICKLLQAKNPGIDVIPVSAAKHQGFEKLKEDLIAKSPEEDKELHILGDLVQPDDIVVLVIPIDSAAPKGRLIMPQQQTIRDLLDHQAVALVTQTEGLAKIIKKFQGQIRMVVTDSQAFEEVSAIVPEDISLTSFSILFARHKGDLKKLSQGVQALQGIQDGDHVLIAEGCTHHRQCDDIGTVKIPRWLQENTGKKIKIETCSGREFPKDLSSYSTIIHCGGCTLSEREMKYRIQQAENQGVPMVNYGIFIAYVKGILERSLDLFKG